MKKEKLIFIGIIVLIATAVLFYLVNLTDRINSAWVLFGGLVIFSLIVRWIIKKK